MCEPISWSTAIAAAGAVASAAGTAMTVANNQSMAAAQNRAQAEAAQRAALLRQREMQRQGEMTEERMAAYGQQVQNRAPGDVFADASAQTGQIMDDQQRLASAFDVSLPGQDRAPVEVQQDAAAGLARATAETRKRIEALARISGQDGALGRAGSEANIYNADAGLAASKARRSLGLYQQESQAVQPTVTAGGLAGLGQAFSGLGSLGLQYAGSQGAFGGGKSTSSSGSTSSTSAGRA